MAAVYLRVCKAFWSYRKNKHVRNSPLFYGYDDDMIWIVWLVLISISKSMIWGRQLGVHFFSNLKSSQMWAENGLKQWPFLLLNDGQRVATGLQLVEHVALWFLQVLMPWRMRQQCQPVPGPLRGIKHWPFWGSVGWNFKVFFFGSTTRIITFLVGDPYKPSFATVTGRGTTQYIYIYLSIYLPSLKLTFSHWKWMVGILLSYWDGIFWANR